MKKFYFLLVALMVCLVGQAQNSGKNFWLIGVGGQWNAAGSKAMTFQSNDGTYDIYTITLESLSGEFKVIDNGNASWSGTNFGRQDNDVLTLDTEYNAWAGSNNFQTSGATFTDVTVTFKYNVNGTPSKILLTSEKEAEIVIPDKVYVRGEISGSDWPAVDAYSLTLTSKDANDAGEYVFTNTFDKFYGQFKIADDSWSSINFGGPSNPTTITVNERMELVGGGENLTCGGSEYEDFTITFYYNPKGTSYALFSANSSSYPEEMYIIGSFTGVNTWDPTSGVKMNTTDNGVYTVDIEVPSNGGGFSFATQLSTTGDWSELGTRYGSTVKQDQPVVIDGENPIGTDGNNSFAINAGSYTITLDLTTMNMTVTGSVEYPEALYVIGNINGNGGDWDPTDGIRLQSTGEGVYEGEVTIIRALDNDYGYFSVTDKLATASDWTGIGARYGAESDGTVVGNNSKAQIVSGSTYAWSVSIAPALLATFDITVSLEDMTITLGDITTFVEDVTVDNNVAPVYYNLQGVRVDNPTNGLYIVVRGNEVSKQVIR